LVENVCIKIADKRNDIPFGKTFKTASGSAVRVVLTKPQWNRFRGYLTIPEELTIEEAEEVRLKAVLDPARIDNLHWGFYTY
jgi:hypothetical protein